MSVATATLTEFFLTIFFLFFTTLAFLTRDVYVFSIAGFVSIIFGIDLGLLYLNDTVVNWPLEVLGFALIFFGLWLLVAAIQFRLHSKRGGK